MDQEYFNFLDKECPLPEDSDAITFFNKSKTQLSSGNFEKWKSMKTAGMIHILKSFAYIVDKERFSTVQTKSKLDTSLRNSIIVYCLTELPIQFTSMLRTAEQMNDNSPWSPAKYVAWKEIAPIAQEFIRTFVVTLNLLEEEELIVYSLQQSQKFLPYFAPFPNTYLSIFLRKLLTFWGNNSERIRSNAYITINQFAFQIPYPFFNCCLKGLYLTYLANSQFVSENSQHVNDFMLESVLDLYSSDLVSSYQHAYQYVQALSFQIRQTYLLKPEERDQICSWKTINSVKVWVKLLSKFPNDKPLWNLGLWLTQIIHGLICLVPSLSDFPFRFQLVALLNELAEAKSFTKNIEHAVFVNSATYLIEFLKDQYFGTVFKAVTPINPVALSFSEMESKTVQETIFGSIYSGLVNYFKCYANSIAFPELTLPTVKILKSLREFCVLTFKSRIDSFLDAVTENSRFIIQKRNVVNFSPHEKDKVNQFVSSCAKCPFSKFCNQLRNNSIAMEEEGNEDLDVSSETSDSDSSDSEQDDEHYDNESEDDDRAIAAMRDEYL